MKIIGVVGSPRKNGNVDTLVETVLEGAKEVGYQTVKYNLNEMDYSGCQACDYCRTQNRCRLDDDVLKLLNDIVEADAVVFGSPIYFSQFTGQFRLMEDRMWSLMDSDFRSRLKPGKKAVVVISQGDPDLAAYDNISKEFARVLELLGFKVIEIIRMANGMSPDAVKGRKDLLEKAKAAGRSL